jgi:hypothetical protein
VTPGERTWSTALWFLSRDVDRAFYLQEVHGDDGSGHCRGCRSQTTWICHPCLQRQLADEAVARLIPLQRGSDDRT